ncbi:Sulfoacetaldehyde reductase [Anaerohalosphaera lusitana]|uniref:Sulfoacetaldehyde reductase n=1 Tax=Anaerohalosphaera lusitana TaxID=1936003 RepID=A0A1U9NIC2_9BACT|nr:SDR family NAD(P)-dependent oxidoreductase [Anaerohalosphaera lusitana]AQT67679.1 Sulfoacetaldehyde reductase [Anaerohalosphaera lusitana]
MPKAIIIGATSGIGRACALELADRGYVVAATGRRTEKLEQLKDEIGINCHIRRMDVTDTEDARKGFLELAEKMGGCDTVIINSGIGYADNRPKWANEKSTIDVNVTGFVALASRALDYFTEHGGGHIVGISSIAGLRGGPSCAYNASKAFVSNYMDGLRFTADKNNIAVTDVRPGFVETPLIEGRDRLFWVASSQKAAKQIADAMQNKKKRVYITRRWTIIAALIKILPDWAYFRIR